MHRDFYFFGLFFFGLYVLASLFQGIIFFQFGNEVYRLQSFSGWLLVLISISMICALFMLKYYQHQGYRFTLIIAIISVIADLCQYTIFYFLLQMVRELEAYYFPALIFSIGAGIVYAISLLFSKAGKKSWLKIAGVFMLILGTVSAGVLIWSMNHQDVQSYAVVEKISQWLALVGSLLPLPFIMLFYSELKALKADREAYSQSKFRKYKFIDLLYGLGGISVMLTLVFSLKVGSQLYWKTHISPRTKAMAEAFEARTYVNDEGANLQYRLLKPLNYDPDQQYPMVVCLHGGAGWGTDNYRQFDGAMFARMLSRNENRAQYPAFLFVPQCPPGLSWGGLPNHPPIDTLVYETINALENEFAIDKSRIYVTGHSLGAYGVWYFIGTRPEMFAAGVPVAGEGDPKLANNMAGVPVWAFHGANDRNVPVSGSREVIEAIKKAGGSPRYTESPDGGHSWEIVDAAPDLLDWLFAQKRDSVP